MAENNSGEGQTAISPQAIIVICLVSAGVVLLCAWAIGRHFYNNTDSSSPAAYEAGVTDGLNQAQHMRLVRLRNQEFLQRKYGGLARPKSAMYSSHVSEV